ncbi:AAA family ATPase, partial [Francisella tularensis]|uniref:AAA family ATPase n=1 Tax=Francisella tularensis TaxID=263 RepID=UPI00167FEBFC
SESDSVEMCVGVGSARVREMFEHSRKKAPCLFFIDEIDAVGRHRGSGMGGGNDEREQTHNQMLDAMDDFADHEGVIVIAATNRPDDLVRELLRTGRIDREVTVGLPTAKGSEESIQGHMQTTVLSE